MVGSVHGGGMHGRGVCVCCGEACMVGVCVAGGVIVVGGMRAGETATEVGGTHPTRMHSCLQMCLLRNLFQDRRRPEHG